MSGRFEILNDGEGIAGYELNVSCPNTAHGGLQFGSDPRVAGGSGDVDGEARGAAAADREALAERHQHRADGAYVAQEAGADALSLVNTFVAMAIDADTRKPRIANVTAGLSGPAIKPIALRMVYDAAHAVRYSGNRHGRDFQCGGCCGVHAGGSDCGADWHG
jgi:dihydroorotate dehydrogenase (NAD+) catalytic subunit